MRGAKGYHIMGQAVRPCDSAVTKVMSEFLAPRNYQWQCSGNDLILHQQKSACRCAARHSVHRAGRGRVQQQFVDFGRHLHLDLGVVQRQFVERARSVRHRQRRLCVLADVPQ